MIKKFVQLKLYIDRSRMWMTYASFFMIASIFMDNFDIVIFSSKKLTVLLLIPLALLAMALLGWLDAKIGLRKYEQILNTEHNPVWMEMIDRTKRIEQLLKK